MLESARITVTVKEGNLEVLEKIAKANKVTRGIQLSQIVNEILEGMEPVIESGSTAKAKKMMFKTALTKMLEVLEED